MIEKYIPMEECKHGFLYKIHSRDLAYGVFNKETNSFIGIGYEFKIPYLKIEDHWDIGYPYGTVNPVLELYEIELENKELKEDNNELFNFLITNNYTL